MPPPAATAPSSSRASSSATPSAPATSAAPPTWPAATPRASGPRTRSRRPHVQTRSRCSPPGPRTEVFSEDLSRALVWAYDLPGANPPDDSISNPPNLNNLYQLDTATGALRTISHSYADPIGLADFFNRTLWGASADLEHVGVVAPTKMLPDPGITPGVENAYTWDDGTLNLAGTLPNGAVPVAGSNVAPTDVRNTMSEDGSRFAFFSTDDGSRPRQLYLHVDGKPSVWVSQPEGTDQSDPVNVSFEGMTPDGKSVFFDTNSPLLDADTSPGPDMYRYTESADPASDSNLTLITTDGGAVNDPFGGGAALVGMSDDGKRVYTHSGLSHLDLWQEGIGTKTIAPGLARPAPGAGYLTLTATQPGNGRVSADGNWVAYLAEGEMHLYSREDDNVTCVSCPSGASLVPTVTNTGRLDFDGFRPRFLTDDGTVFFTSTGGLVPEDTNGVADVYSYNGPSGKLSLVTSGRGSEPMEFADAGKGGNDVFFVTRQRLISSDTDDFVDLYDARVGGGVDEPESPTVVPCAGESCQGAASASAAAPAIRSGAAARGNLRQRRPRCAKNERKVQRQGKVRCVKKHGKHHKRHNGRPAGAGPGGSK